MKRIIAAVAALLFCLAGTTVSAQSGYQVKGVVVDATGPVIGATVMEQGTSNGTSTGFDGDYVLNVSSPDAIVVISCIGYTSQSFKASAVPAVVTIVEDSEFLDDVVVIGYGTVKKNDMTGSITAIKTEELNRGAIVSTQDMLKGKVAGLQVIPGDGRPGGGSTIRVRGAASLNASKSRVSLSSRMLLRLPSMDPALPTALSLLRPRRVSLESLRFPITVASALARMPTVWIS